MDESLTIPIDALWAVDEPRFTAALMGLRGVARPELVSAASRREPVAFTRDGSIAVVDVLGPLTKRASWWSVYMDASSYAGIQSAIEQAVDSDAEGILLRVDSPGGAVDGLAQAGDAVFAARQKKPVVAFVEGMAASAAYYLASQAESVVVQRQDLVGSIGTRLMLYDFSGLFEKEGIRAIPIDTGEFKSAAAVGTKLTDRQVEYFQGIVDAYFRDFASAVRRGRGMSRDAFAKVSDGRIFSAGDAMDFGLVDRIGTRQTALAELFSEAKRRGRGTVKAAQETTMGTETNSAAAATVVAAVPQATAELRMEAKAATIAELKSAIPDSDPAFREQCQEKGLTLQQSQTEWMGKLREKCAAQEKELAAARATRAVGSSGVATSRSDATTIGGDAKSRWNAAVDEKLRQGMTRENATASVAVENPQLRQAFLEEHNVRFGRAVSAVA